MHEKDTAPKGANYKDVRIYSDDIPATLEIKGNDGRVLWTLTIHISDINRKWCGENKCQFYTLSRLSDYHSAYTRCSLFDQNLFYHDDFIHAFPYLRCDECREAEQKPNLDTITADFVLEMRTLLARIKGKTYVSQADDSVDD